MRCDKNALLLFWSGELTAGEAREMRNHLDQCDECRAELAELGEWALGFRSEPVEQAPRDFVSTAMEQTGKPSVLRPSFLRKPSAFLPFAGSLAAAAAVLLVLYAPWDQGPVPEGRMNSPLVTYASMKKRLNGVPALGAKRKHISGRRSFPVRTGKLVAKIRMAKRAIDSL